jgi:uncharacterized membrane protein
MSLLRSTVVVALVLLTLDLAWLGIVAADLYAAQLGPLMAPEVDGLAAALFYLMYLGAVVLLAVRPATSIGDAATRGATLGFVCYATYELTNWAVIADWPALLVPIDIGWGVLLTGVSAAAGWKAR